jgi:hypothetical protein
VDTWRALQHLPRFSVAARRALRRRDAGGFLVTARRVTSHATARLQLERALPASARDALAAMTNANPLTTRLRLPAVLRRHLAAEQVLLGALGQGRRVPESAHLDAWLGGLPRATAEEVLGVNLQNTARGLFTLG